MNMGELDQIAPALVAALGALEDPVKDGKVAAGQRRYTYLTLPHLLAAVRPVLAAHGLCVLQDVEMSSEGVGVTTVLVHVSGQVMCSSPLVGALGSRDPQSVGSAVTYMRRYSLSALLGLAGSDDDDGQHAAPQPQPARQQVRVERVPPADDGFITPRQRGHVGALIGDWEAKVNGGVRLGTEERREFIGSLVGRKLGSANELTKQEAGRVIGQLQEVLAAAEKDGPDGL
jgi:ERF superfamily